MGTDCARLLWALIVDVYRGRWLWACSVGMGEPARGVSDFLPSTKARPPAQPSPKPSEALGSFVGLLGADVLKAMVCDSATTCALCAGHCVPLCLRCALRAMWLKSHFTTCTPSFLASSWHGQPSPFLTLLCHALQGPMKSCPTAHTDTQKQHTCTAAHTQLPGKKP